MTDISSDLNAYGVGVTGGAAFSGERSQLNGLMPFAGRHESSLPRIRYFALGLVLAAAEMYLISVLFQFTFGNGPWHV